MHDPFSAPIVVAIPHDGVDSALRLAAREALVRGCPLEVVGYADAGATGTAYIEDAAVVAEVLAGPGVPVHTRIVADPRLEAVLATSVDAGLVIIHRSSVLDLLHTLSHGRVGMRALTTIACAPSSWVPVPDPPPPVVVAVDDAFHSRGLLVAGLEQAHLHHAPLRVVHAWDLPCRLGEEEDATLSALWARELDQRLHDQASALHAAGVTIDVRRGAPADVVLEASLGAQLVVLGRRGPSDDDVPHLGRTTRTALRESPCPVVLLPAAAAATAATAGARSVPVGP